MRPIGYKDETVFNDPNPGQTFRDDDSDLSDMKEKDIKLALDHFKIYADEDSFKEMDADQGSGMQLGSSKTFLKHVARAAKRHIADLEEAAISQGSKFYGYPSNTLEDESRIKEDGRDLLDQALDNARNEFILKSGGSLPGRMTRSK
ncbi:hypothetical protein ES705_24346 [subsurface metagenome]